MGKEIKQFRYVYSTDEEINVEEITREGALVTSLYIQTLPGIKMEINSQEIEIGRTGVYELEEKTGLIINSLRFDKTSLLTISKNADAYLIINAVYKEV